MISRGYVASHKISEGQKPLQLELPLGLVTTISCPNCKEKNSVPYRYDENLDEIVTCSSCRFTTSLWNYEFISCNIEEGDNE